METSTLPERNLLTLILLGCLLGAAAAAGCLGPSGVPETPDTTPEATISAHTTYVPAGPQPSFTASATTPKKHMRSDGSCYWAATGTVTNTGDGPARNVIIRFMLIDDESNMIRATETIPAGRFQAGETKMFTIDPFPGDCDRTYHVEIEIMREIP